jgi:hypothetical protein
LVARRRWEDLPAEAARRVLEDRRLPAGSVESPPASRVSVLFSPEASALIVQALVRTLHVAGADHGLAVGPAWRVTDDPRDPASLFGGIFDDSGFTTRKERLANGLRCVGEISGPGHYRRPSFRDPPEALPSHLVVEARDQPAPERAVVATVVGLHPVAPDRWLLRIEGAHLERGQPGSPLRPSHISISPRDLVRRCTATIGPSRASYRGVQTPALLFEELPLY